MSGGDPCCILGVANLDLAKLADSLLVALSEKCALLRRLLSMKTVSVAFSKPCLVISVIQPHIFQVKPVFQLGDAS